MDILMMEQGSPEWHAAKLGMISASNADKVLSKSSPRETYLYKLAAERATGIGEESFSNSAMEWGVEHEPQARAIYELETGQDVVECGFVVKDEWVGASPDGYVGSLGGEGLIEIKCPNSSTHLKTIKANKVPARYKHQMQFQMWVTEAKWCDFVSFDPRLTSRSMHIIRVERDDKAIASLIEAVGSFVVDLQSILKAAE